MNNNRHILDSDLFVSVARELLGRGCMVRFRAAGESMHPVIRDGEPLTLEAAPADRIGRGDVVLFAPAWRGPVAHRISKVRSGSIRTFVTRGDNTDSADAPIPASCVLGRVVSVTRDQGDVAIAGRPIAPLVRSMARGVGGLRRAARVAALVCASVIGAAPASGQMITGTYTGDGNDGVRIDGVGFQPDVVILKAGGASTQVAVIRTSTMGTNEAKPMTGATAVAANLIESFEGGAVNGAFTVGSDARVNANGIAYYFAAFRAASKRMAVGTYTGNGSASRSITGVGFSPELVFIMSAGANEAVYRSSADTESFNFATSAGATCITALGADGFTVNADARVNANGTVYHYVAWNEVVDVMDVGTYTGTGTDPTTITTPGFRPEYVFVKNDGANDAVHHPASIGASTDQTLQFGANPVNTNRIQTLNEDGFEVGNDADVNTSGSGYHYFAWRRTMPEAHVISGSYTGNGTDNRAITGVGFSPDVVYIKGDTAQYGVIRAWTQFGDITIDTNGLTTGNMIQSLDAEGFTIGTDATVNSNGVTYHWVAWQRGAGEMEVGIYTGNGTSLNVTELGFSPDFVIVMGNSADPVYRNAAASTSYSLLGATSASWITALGTDGFTVGNSTSVNASGAIYAWIAWNEIAGKMDVGSYSGDGTDNRNVTGVGFQPEYALVHRQAAGYNVLAHPASIGISTDLSLFFSAQGAFANYIQALQADGFQVGNQTNVNASGASYAYAAWAAPTATAVRMTGTSAVRAADRVIVRWRTGYEVDNLGFHVYRDDGGERVQLTAVPVNGSALLVGPGVPWSEPFSYRWVDYAPGSETAAYWIEDIDLSGKTTLHGPIPQRREVEPGADRRAGDRWQTFGGGRPVQAPATSADPGRQVGAVAAPSDESAQAPARQAAPGQTASPRASVGVAAVAPAPSRPDTPQPHASSPRSGGSTVSPQEKLQYRLASGRAARVEIREAGWYRVTAAQILGAGIDPNVDPRRLQVFAGGVEQAVLVRGDDDGRLDAADSVEFYGEGTDTPYTDTRVYWIVSGDQPGARIAAVEAAAAGEPAIASFPHTAERKDRIIYFSALLNGEAENFFGPLVTGDESTDQTVQVVFPDPAALTARLEVLLQGVSEWTENPAHEVAVWVNGHEAGVVRFTGREQGFGAWDVDASWLVEGENVVTLLGSSEFDYSLVDRIRLTYLRQFRPERGVIRASAPSGREVEIGPFAASSVLVADVTDPSRPLLLEGEIRQRADGFFAAVRIGASGTRALLALPAGTALAPASVSGNTPSAWHREALGAGVVAVAPRAFVESLAPLKRLREGQGYRVAVAAIEDVYDEFSFGEKTPFALKRFLLATQPRDGGRRFVLLVGNATSDPRDYYGFGVPDLVPTKMVPTGALEAASDDWFVDADDDGQPDAGIVGRLPVRTAAEAATVVAKIVNYEKGGSGDWSKSLMLVAQPPAETDLDYYAASAVLGPLVPADYSVTRVGTTENAATRGEVVSRMNEGQLLVNFVGHGSVDLWGGDLLSGEDAFGLTNGTRLPFVVAMNCLNGFFQGLFPEESLAESLLRAPNGGAIAVWASSAVTSPNWQTRMNQELFRRIFNGPAASLGEMAAAAKALVGNPDVRRSWIFFGDPLTRLKGVSARQTVPGLQQPPADAPSGESAAAESTAADADADGDGAEGDATETEPVRLADFNGDGLGEPLLLAENGSWTIAFNDGAGFGAIGAPPAMAGQAFPARLNDDGLRDVFWYDAQTGAWAETLNQGDGSFAVRASGAWMAERVVRVADLDANGYSDVFLHDPERGDWMALLGDGGGHFTLRTGAPFQPGTAHVVAANNDRAADLLVHDARTGEWTLAVNAGNGSFRTSTERWESGWKLQPADLTGDGLTDLVLWHPQSNAWVEAWMHPSGAFVQRWRTRVGTGQPAVLDVNGDGRDDVLWHDARSGAWSLQVADAAGLTANYAGRWEVGWELSMGNLDASPGADVLLHSPEAGLWQRLSFDGSMWEPVASGTWPGGWTVVGRR